MVRTCTVNKIAPASVLWKVSLKFIFYKTAGIYFAIWCQSLYIHSWIIYVYCLASVLCWWLCLQHFLVPTQLTTAFSMQEDDVHIYLSIIYYCLATIWPPFKTTIKINNWRVHWSQSNNKQTRLLQQTKWRYMMWWWKNLIFFKFTFFSKSFISYDFCGFLFEIFTIIDRLHPGIYN